jgi:DUF4097 and DUF4098 domain-containing protein YvlB
VLLKGDVERVTFDTVSGDMTYFGSAREVQAKAVSGDIQAKGEIATLTAETVSGDIEVNGLAGKAAVETTSGDLDLKASVLEEGDFGTISGEIEFAGALAAGGKLEAATRSGEVTLNLPANTDAAFSLKSISGDIDIALKGASPQVTRTDPGKSANFVVGSGSAKVGVKTMSGEIEISQR